MTNANRSCRNLYAAADEVDDFDFVAVVDHRGIVGRLLDDGEVQFDGDAPGIDLELLRAASLTLSGPGSSCGSPFSLMVMLRTGVGSYQHGDALSESEPVERWHRIDVAEL